MAHFTVERWTYHISRVVSRTHRIEIQSIRSNIFDSNQNLFVSSAAAYNRCFFFASNFIFGQKQLVAFELNLAENE